MLYSVDCLIFYIKQGNRKRSVEMNIAIDIDDTLTDSFSYFQPFVAEYFGADVTQLKRNNIS